MAGACSWQRCSGACSCKSCCLGGLRKRLGGFRGFEGGQTAVLNPLKNRWQGHVAVRVVALEACGRVGSVWGVWWGRANGSLEPPEKQMAAACSCKSCCLFGGFEAGQTRPARCSGACSCKSSCLGGLRKRLGGFRGFEGGQTAVLNPLKNRW